MSSTTVTLRFNGLAPIPTGSNITVLVDNPKNPKIAISIQDDTHRIFYSNEEPTKRALTSPLADYVTGLVSSVKAFAYNNTTELTVIDVKPKSTQ